MATGTQILCRLAGCTKKHYRWDCLCNVPECGRVMGRGAGRGMCNKCYVKDFRHRHPNGSHQYSKERHLKTLYGISLADYDALLAAQNGRCAICFDLPGARKLAVDHCHQTGKIRGLLCQTCNTGMGQLRDSPELCERAAQYLRRARGDRD